MIEALCIERFRGIKKSCIAGFKQVTILSGGNGVGKSTLLEAIYASSAPLRSQDELRGIDKLDYLILRRGGRGSWKDSRNVIWYNMDISQPITITLQVKGTRYDFLLTNESLTSSPIYAWVNTNEGLINFEAGKMLLRGSGEEVVAKRQPDPVLASMFSSVLLLDQYTLREPSIIEELCWSKLIASRLDKKIIMFLRSGLIRDAEGLTYAPVGGGNTLFLQTSKTSIRLEDAGEGVRNGVLLAMVVLALRPQLILLDDPEVGMDSAALYTFTKLLLETIRTTGSQVFIATRSMELVEMGEALSSEIGGEISTIFLEKMQDGVLAARTSPQEATGIV
ncbi:MAG: hypothetical protein QXY49_03105 [Thermofilaceae archaeon]